jgi:hypothetical protein
MPYERYPDSRIRAASPIGCLVQPARYVCAVRLAAMPVNWAVNAGGAKSALLFLTHWQ